MDRGQVMILPTLPTLCKLWKALSTKTITDWSKKRSPYMNEEGYLYHDDVRHSFFQPEPYSLTFCRSFLATPRSKS